MVFTLKMLDSQYRVETEGHDSDLRGLLTRPRTSPTQRISPSALCFTCRVLALHTASLARMSVEKVRPQTQVRHGPRPGFEFSKAASLLNRWMCGSCGTDLLYVQRRPTSGGSRLLPCQHLLCKACFQGCLQELGHVPRAYWTAPGGKYETSRSASVYRSGLFLFQRRQVKRESESKCPRDSHC